MTRRGLLYQIGSVVRNENNINEFQIQCEDVWLFRMIRQWVARSKANRENVGNEDAASIDAKIAKEMAQRQKMIESQVRGIGTDVGIVSRFRFFFSKSLLLLQLSLFKKVEKETRKFSVTR